MRVGFGIEFRLSEPSRPLCLAGVEIPGRAGLEGPYAGDVVVAAVIEAVIGAAAMSPTDAGLPSRDAESSSEALQTVVQLVERENYQVINLDITLAGEDAPVAGQGTEMRERLADLIHVSPANVSLKEASDGLLARMGRPDGMAAAAVILLDQIADLDALHASIRSGG